MRYRPPRTCSLVPTAHCALPTSHSLLYRHGFPLQVRYQQPLERCTVRLGDERSPASPTLDVAFDEPLRHVAEQQALVLYDGEVCLGAATIVSRGPSAYDVAVAYPSQQHQRPQQHADEQQPQATSLGGAVGTKGSVEV